jgi:tetratricopeptide (TPR) repeat protein
MKFQKVMIAVILLGSFELAPRSAASQPTKSDNQITYYQQLLRRNPRSANAYFGLGDALIRKARESGDPSYFTRAQEALKKTLQLTPENAGALRHMGYVYYSRHEFAPAVLYARKAIEINSEDSDAYGVLGDALLELGQYAEAQAAYAYMMELDESLYSYSRLAGLKSLSGDSLGAIADLKRAVAAGKATKQPTESIAWAAWQLGMEYFAMGELQNAEDHFQQSLATQANYYRALSGLAQVRAAQKRYDEAVDLYQKAIAILPMPEYAAALGEIYEKIGNSELARRQYELVEYIGRLNALNQVLYNRELAYFYADHDTKPKEGLALARRELEYRRDIYAYDVVAWSLYRNGAPEQAREAIDKALRLGTKDAKLLFHAGMIYHRLGATAAAKDFLRRALSINPNFHILLADEAARTVEEIDSGQGRIAVNQPSQGR